MRSIITLLLLLTLVVTIVIDWTPTLSSVPHAVDIPLKRSSSAIDLTPDGNILLVVNTDSNSITLIDRTDHTVLREISVGIDPRTVTVDDAGERAYVANRGSASLSVVDLVGQVVLSEIPLGERPYGVLVSPDGDFLYVSEQGSDQLSIIDANTLEITASIAMENRPSGLALSDDGKTLYVTHLLDNNISVITFYDSYVFLPLLLKRFPVHFNPYYAVSQPSQGNTAYHYAIREITLWPDSNLLQSIVLSPDGEVAYIPHTRSNTNNRALTFDTTVFPLVSVIDLKTNQHLIGEQFALGTLDPPGVGLPFDAALTPDSHELWVVNVASNDITVIDLLNRQRTAHVEVGDNPRGIVLSHDGSTAYVNNTLAGTVSVIDTATYTVTDVITTTQIPLSPILLQGKRLFHSSDDPRMSNAQWIACNTCHFEGEHDGRTWFFGFAGPRNTTSLLGMIQTYPLRWSGEWDESADSEFANRKENFGNGLIDGEMNCTPFPPDCVNHPPNQGRSDDLDALAAFIDSLPIPLSPAHAHGEPLTKAEQRGQVIFNNPVLGCITCHPPPLYTDHQLHDVGTATVDEGIGPAYDTPSLRGLYNSAPYFHDGSAETLYDTLTRASPGNEHDLSGVLSESEIADLIAYLLALPFEE